MSTDYERMRRELGLEAAFEAAVRDLRGLAAENGRLRKRLTACEKRLTAAEVKQLAQREEIERLRQSRIDWQQAAQLWESNALSLLEELKRFRARSQEPPRRQ
jgi:hypothetical protein